MGMVLVNRVDLLYQRIVFEHMEIGLEIVGKVHTTLDQRIVEHGHDGLFDNICGGLLARLDRGVLASQISIFHTCT